MNKKHDLPAMPFYWGDWFKALDIQALPRDIRCTWFEMLGRMWESKKRGYLSINGEALSIEELAQLLGFGNDIKNCEKHINFLEKKGVFSRTKNGVIFNRRMAKDCSLSVKRGKAGKKGMKIRYNKIPNKSVTNTEDEYEDENEKNKEKKEGDARGRKQRGNHSFKTSEYFDYEKFKKAFTEDPKYADYDVGHYYEAVKNWSESKGVLRSDWIATARGFVITDEGDGKAKKNIYRSISKPNRDIDPAKATALLKNIDLTELKNKLNGSSAKTFEELKNWEVGEIESLAGKLIKSEKIQKNSNNTGLINFSIFEKLKGMK